MVAGDDVSLDSSGANSAFGDADVGTDKPVGCNGFTLSGADASNYTLTVSPTTADITPKPITGSCTVANKVYDGTTAATITGSSLNGVVAGDSVTLNTSGANFGVRRPRTWARQGDAVQWLRPRWCRRRQLHAHDESTTANITPKPVLVTCTAADKAFDSNNSATITGAILTGVVRVVR